MRQLTWSILVLVVVCSGSLHPDLHAQSNDNKAVTGYSTLVEKYGLSNLESGAGILCTHPEDPGPMRDNPLHFSGINFIDHNMHVRPGTSINSHASRVGRNFYGNFSYARDVSEVCLYRQSDWFDLLRTVTPGSEPQTTSLVTSLSIAFDPKARVLRFIPGDFAESFSRLDYAIDTQDVVMVAGAPRDRRMFPHGCYNVISVKASYENTPLPLISQYFPERTKPEIKAPSRINVEDSHGTPSNAAPMVASAAALLYSAATSENASKSEVIRAALLAGATKKEFPDWTHTESAPLAVTHGVGELNVFNSYEILKAGEFTPGLLPAPLIGWHYGEIGSGDTQDFSFVIPINVDEFNIVLAWNARVQDVDPGANFNAETEVTNIDLELTKMKLIGTGVVGRSSSIDYNVEHIYLRNPEAGFYTLRVTNDPAGFDWDYGIAWRTSTFKPQLASDFIVATGTEQSGQLPDIQASDDNYLAIQPSVDDVVSVEFETVLPKVAPTGLKFAIESHVTSPDLLQTVEYYDFLRQQWFELDPGSPANSTDTNVPLEFELEGEMFDYISALNNSDFGKVRFRVSWETTNSPPDNWEVNVDHVGWEVAY